MFLISDFSTCEADINYNVQRYDPDTRRWLLNDFDAWFSDPDKSRAYVLLADAAVGKSVMAAVIAKRAKNDGNLAAAYFCRHYDGTRRDPRYLLGTVAYQLSNCNNEYDKRVGGETGIQNMLANAKLGVHELFTKLLEEPLSKCRTCQRKLVVIDALDEAEYWSREDFLDLIMNRFPLLPTWLVFFITSRPEDTVQLRLRTYNPCVRICAGDSESAGFYQQHEQDIQQFLEKRINFCTLLYSSKEIAEKCNGMFLYAFYIVEILKNSGRLNRDIFPENINDYFRKNFKRVCETVGGDFYKKLFGCVLVAPSPLPISFISFLLQREDCVLDRQEVIDAVSQFVRITNQTFTFLHSLIPTWLTDEQKASRRLFIERNEANAYFRNIIVRFLQNFLHEGKDKLSFDKPDSVNYILVDGFRFLYNCGVQNSMDSEIVFCCLTNYRFLQKRIQCNKVGIYALIEDLEFSICALVFDESEKTILSDICSVLKRDKFVVFESPGLLSSCLSNASKLTRDMVMPSKVLDIWMEYLDIEIPNTELFKSMQCCVFSHDKKLFAGEKWGDIFLYDARTHEKVLGPIKIMDNENVSYSARLSSQEFKHLEFSPDDKFVFYGRLDKWFSVEKKRVVEINQFSENSKCYEWGSFIYDGRYIAVIREEPDHERVHHNFLVQVFYIWFLQELGLEEHNRHKFQCLSDRIKCECEESFENLFSPFLRENTRYSVEVIHYIYTEYKMCLQQEKLLHCPNMSCDFCTKCREFMRSNTPGRDCIVRLYTDIFTYQIWNVETGRPVIEEMFSLQLKPFFLLWHLFPALEGLENDICDIDVTLADVALLNAVYHWSRSFFDVWGSSLDEFESRTDVIPSYDINELVRSLKREGVAHDKDTQMVMMITNSPVECYNHIFNGTNIVSKDGKWLAMKIASAIILFKKVKEGKNWLKKQQDIFSDIEEGDSCCFTSDSNVFLYFTHSNLYAYSLATRIRLQSISGTYPVFCPSEDGQDIGYIFGDTKERIIVFLRDLPEKFFLHFMSYKPVDVTFPSADTILFLCSDATLMWWKIGHGVQAWMCTKMVKLHYSSKIHVKKSVFSHDGKLIAMHQSREILLFSCKGEFHWLVVTVTEECEHTVSCLTFSADDSLLLFCIEKTNDDQSFYVWEIKNKVLTGPITLPLPIILPLCGMHVDCSCFSSDNVKLYLCHATSVLILEYPYKVVSHSIRIPNFNSWASDICSHCTVSSDNKLLVCCIANEILIYPLNDPDNFWNVPTNHSCKIEYCKFLKGNRYLISYGIDGLVFLFDLVKWKSIAYARQESIIRMAVSPDEDKVVCLGSSAEVSIINLHGLRCGLPSNFLLPRNFSLPEKKRKPKNEGKLLHHPPVQVEFEKDFFDEDG